MESTGFVLAISREKHGLLRKKGLKGNKQKLRLVKIPWSET
jgi:hypothetical protein